MRLRRPDVFVLTDGSGSTNQSRLEQTEVVLRAAHARRTGWLATLTDKEVYHLILQGEITAFVDRVRELAEYIISHAVQEIAGDMIEGYNPSHDLCRNIINAAVELAAGQGHPIRRNLAFPLVAKPAAEKKIQPAEALQLDAAALHDKQEIAMSYGALRHEVEAALQISGKEMFATEVLYDAAPLGDAPPEIPPQYERYGEKRVAAGLYRDAIRYRTHVAPLVARLRSTLGLQS